MDISSVIRDLATGSYTLIRRTPGARNTTTGLRAAPTETRQTITDTVVLPEPSLADDEQRNRAGAWSTDRIMVYAPIDQLAATGGALTATTTEQLADRIVYQGKIYEVTDSLDWGEAGGYSQARFGIVDPAIEAGA